MKINNVRPIPLLFILLILLLIMQQTLTFGSNTLLSSGIHNSAHGPWFALVTYLIWRIVSATFRFRFNFVGKLSLTILIAVFIALMSEFAEKFNGKEVSWEDIFQDMCGMVSAILFIVGCKIRKGKPSENQNPVLFTLGGLLLFITLYPFFLAAAITLHHKDFQPRLLSFDSYLDYATLLNTDGEKQLITAPETWLKFTDQKVMKIKLADTRWPGFNLKTPTSNWRTYVYLVVEIYNDSDRSLPFSISIRPDSLIDDGTISFFRRLHLLPGANSLRISIDDLLPNREEIEWQVRSIIGYTPRSFAGRTIYLREIRLE